MSLSYSKLFLVVMSGILQLSAANTVHAALVTDSSTFTAVNITYDSDTWGVIKDAREADSFTGTTPINQYGFSSLFFDPQLALSSSGQANSDHEIKGQITITAKDGWGVYEAFFAQTGQWTTNGSGQVDVSQSSVDVNATNGQFFTKTNQAYLGTLQTPHDGFYYINGESSSFSTYKAIYINYDIHLTATGGDNGSAEIHSDTSDPSYLYNFGPYPNINTIGTYIETSFVRVSPVPEPDTYALMLAGLGLIGLMSKCRNRLA